MAADDIIRLCEGLTLSADEQNAVNITGEEKSEGARKIALCLCDESNFNGDSSILPYGAWMRASNPGKSQPSWYNRRNQSPPKPNPPRHGQGNTHSDQYHDGKTAFHETANDLNASNIVSSSPGESKAMAVSAAASSEGKTNQMDVSTAATTLIFQQQEG
ncbi:hypothetical protein JRO89_XS08G0024500 [Xanthoceras sorbifolium]|uniref:Uncharacterized protein n=1 Tax=Xanthoceras sorbifolium TaxID=99658 RepID=A0ABQ8HNA5_9ROSI|nr:hypothetical protein JRO89_XS08G0024500 [Xanthoceras sorbifolium]